MDHEHEHDAGSGKYRTLAEVAAHYRKPIRTIRHWRVINYGPRGVRVGNDVLYPVTEIERFDKEIQDQIDAAARPA